jgi:hypothetical protein
MHKKTSGGSSAALISEYPPKDLKNPVKMVAPGPSPDLLWIFKHAVLAVDVVYFARWENASNMGPLKRWGSSKHRQTDFWTAELLSQSDDAMKPDSKHAEHTQMTMITAVKTCS